MEFSKEASECNQSLGAPLTTEQLLLGAERMKQCNALQLEQFLDDPGLVEEEEEEDGDMVNDRFCSPLVDQLFKHMPVLGIHESSTKHWALVNMHDFSFPAQGDTFLDLLLLDQEDKQDTQAHGSTEGQSLEQTMAVYNHLPQCKPGRKPLHTQYPEIVTLVNDFIQIHGFAAESRAFDKSKVGQFCLHETELFYVCMKLLLIYSSLLMRIA